MFPITLSTKTNWMEKTDGGQWSATVTRLPNLFVSFHLWLFFRHRQFVLNAFFFSVCLFLVIKHLVCIIKGCWEDISRTCRESVARLYDRNVAPDHIGWRPQPWTHVGLLMRRISPFPEGIPIERSLAVDLFKTHRHKLLLCPPAPFLVLGACIKLYTWLRSAHRESI